MKLTAIVALTLLGVSGAGAQMRPDSLDLAKVANPAAWRVTHATAESVTIDGRRAVRLIAEGDSANGIVGLAVPVDARFTTGTIDVDLKGSDVRQRSFLGIAFNVADERTFEGVYFRPFNFRAGEPMRSRAVQYISWPDSTWEHLRKTEPGRFENRVEPVPDPNGWFHARIVVTDREVRVHVDGAQQPSLVARRLKPGVAGRPAGLFVDSADGLYANLRITPDP